MSSWLLWIQKVLEKEAHEDITIPKHLVNHPLCEGFTKTFGEPQGQTGDYELTLLDGRRIHVREYRYCYKAHWDKVSPKVDPLKHLIYDAPKWWLIVSALAGATLNCLISKRKENIVNGLLFGAVLGAVVAGIANQRTDRRAHHC
jgi:hypothetical protein